MKRTDHMSPVLRDQGWLSIPDLINLRLACLAFQCLNNSVPVYLSEQLSVVVSFLERRRLRSAASDLLAIPHVRYRTLGGHTFWVGATRTWNCLPSDIMTYVTTTSLWLFKCRVKSFLLDLWIGLEVIRGITPSIFKSVILESSWIEKKLNWIEVTWRWSIIRGAICSKFINCVLNEIN